jgi:serine beta-lactamase-like protein LACTB
VAVSKNGQTIYNRGFGYSDVENCVKANAHTLMRIASISKPISCTMAGILYENGKLDFDKPIDEYIGADVPVFQWKNKQVL